MSVADNAINKYYALKGKYNKKYEAKKYKIIKNDDYSIGEKRILIQHISMNCIKCKQKSGTIFKKVKNNLIAKCGQRTNPCNFNIKIATGESNNINILLDNLEKDLESIKTNILKTKLSVLHGLIEDDEAMKIFTEMKEFYKKYNTSVNNLYKEIEDNLKIAGDTGEKITHKQFIKENNIKIDEFTNLFKTLIGGVNEDVDEKMKVLEDAIGLYINELKPLVIKHRVLGYRINKIISDELYSIDKTPVYKHKLIQTNYDIIDYEIGIEPAEIITENFDTWDTDDKTDDKTDEKPDEKTEGGDVPDISSLFAKDGLPTRKAKRKDLFAMSRRFVEEM
jgi:hypothetical protein